MRDEKSAMGDEKSAMTTDTTAKTTVRKRKRTFWRAAMRVVSLLLTALLLLMMLAVAWLSYCNFSGRVAFIGNRAIMRIITQSMEPLIPAGEYILVERIQPGAVSVGDVIVFTSRDPAIYGMYNTHRVVEINADGSFVTRGDNNSANDPMAVLPEDVAARYLQNLPGVTGFAAIFMQKWVFFVCIVLPAAILLAFCIRDVVKRAKEVRMDLLVHREVERLREGQIEIPTNSDISTGEDTTECFNGESSIDRSKNAENK